MLSRKKKYDEELESLLIIGDLARPRVIKQ